MGREKHIRLLFRASGGWLQYRYSESDSWKNGILLSELGGGSPFTKDITLTQATASYNMANKHVIITVSTGSSLAVNTILSFITLNEFDVHSVTIVNSTGVVLSVTTTSLNNFGGSFPIPIGKTGFFVAHKLLFGGTYADATHSRFDNVGEN